MTKNHWLLYCLYPLIAAHCFLSTVYCFCLLFHCFAPARSRRIKHHSADNPDKPACGRCRRGGKCKIQPWAISCSAGSRRMVAIRSRSTFTGSVSPVQPQNAASRFTCCHRDASASLETAHDVGRLAVPRRAASAARPSPAAPARHRPLSNRAADSTNVTRFW